MTDVLDRTASREHGEPVVSDVVSRQSHLGGARLDSGLAGVPVLAAASAGAAAIHFAMVPAHWDEVWWHGLGFAIVGWLQVMWAWGAWKRVSRRLLAAGVALNLVVIGIYALSRTAGLPGGSDAWIAADMAFIDLVALALELVVVLGALALLFAPTSRVERRLPHFASAVAIFAVIGLTTAAMASPSARDHTHGGTAEGAHDDVAASVSNGAGHTHSSESTSDASGPVSLNGEHIHGVKAQDIAAESEPDVPLDAATRALLADQLVQARETAMRYPTVADARAGGWGLLAGGFAPGSGAHYISYSSMTGGATFDPTHPLSLIYDGIKDSSKIIGLMYYGMGDTAPEGFAGPNDHWHRHSNVCLKYGANGIEVPFPADADVTQAQCTEAGGEIMSITGYMVHAWVVPAWESPLGVFSHDNPNVRCADGTYDTNKAGFCQGT